MALLTDAQIPVPGSLVTARGRDWVVLPSDEEDVLRLRPLIGGEADSIGLFMPLERGNVSPATFEPPDPNRAGDAAGGLLLCDAARLNLRAGAAPFRSLGRISVVPRPYQFVPLIMALRLDPVRLLIADDVGVGKTIEAALIAREMLDRGLAKRLAIVCPAHLCEQWETELREKFGIQAAVVQPSTIGRLERGLPRNDLSIYQYYPHLILSIDFVKTDKNRGPFLQYAPDLVIVDEAHTTARPRGHAGRSQHQRFEFVRELASVPSRHLILVTATPHSGIEESFRSLLGLINPAFDVREDEAEIDRRDLLPYVVQRRRSDLQHWPGTETPFPERRSEERAYPLSDAYRSLFNDVLAYCSESVRPDSGTRRQQQRVRYWAAIALLRCVLSSPDVAVAVLAARSRQAGTGPELMAELDAEIDAVYRPQVLDTADEEEPSDYLPSAPVEDAEAFISDSDKRKLSGFLARARKLAGPEGDRKVAEAARALVEMLDEGYRPIVFCHFIATAKYLEMWLPKLLGKRFPGVRVTAVTGEIGDEERRERVGQLVEHDGKRILVATDCLSEGINLQDQFDAVLHYDLPWNPNRLEQREGRVDRFGQQRAEVRTTVLYGADNPMDQVVRDVLIEKARRIRSQLGISLPIPMESEQVVQAVVDSVLLQSSGRANGGTVQLGLALEVPEVSRLHEQWDSAAEREGKQRAFFRQHGIKPDEVAREVDAIDPVLGDSDTVHRFLKRAAQRFNGELKPSKQAGVYHLLPGEMADAFTSRGYPNVSLAVTFDGVKDPKVEQLGRTHPIVSAYCDAVLGRALSPLAADERFSRCGAIYTNAVTRRTGVALLRLRYSLRAETDEFAEEVVLAAFGRSEGRVQWLEPLNSAGRELLETSQPVGNMSGAERSNHVSSVLGLLLRDEHWYEPVVEARRRQLWESNNRLRKLVRARKLEIRPHNPPDILGLYVLVPIGGWR